jgi:predicted acetyltransferase
MNDATAARIDALCDDTDSLAAWEGDRCVGHAGAFRFDTTVPGGSRVATAGVTRVGVLPTHTRRGLLTALMQQLLHDARGAGKALASLRASETPIYGRFGFGLGGDAVAAVVTPRAAKPLRLTTDAAAGGSMRVLAPGEVMAVVPDLYRRIARWRVGSISRPAWIEQRILAPACELSAVPHSKGVFVAVHTGDSADDDGYVLYETGWNDGFATVPTGSGKVLDLWGASPLVEIELWRYLLDIDLVTTWHAEPRPVDEPVRRALHDARAYEARQRFDEQWIRILDTDVALRTRSYGLALGEVTIEVTDPDFPANSGRWTVSADGAWRSDETADVHTDIATVSAAYLGAVSWSDLRDCGALDRSTPDKVVTTLDSLFRVHPTPFCGTMF